MFTQFLLNEYQYQNCVTPYKILINLSQTEIIPDRVGPVDSRPSTSLIQNDKGSSKYNDILAQHTTWHYRLNAEEKLELMNRNWQVHDFLMFIKGKHGFYNGGKTQKLKSHFWPDKLLNIGPEYTKRCRIGTFGGVCFLRKIDYVNTFMR